MPTSDILCVHEDIQCAPKPVGNFVCQSDLVTESVLAQAGLNACFSTQLTGLTPLLALSSAGIMMPSHKVCLDIDSLYTLQRTCG